MFGFLKKGLDKTLTAIRSSKPADKKISKEILEEILLESDIAYEIVEEVLYYLPPQNEVKKDDLKRLLNTYFIYENEREVKSAKPFVELILGVNGAGKTTTIAKLANLYKNEGKSVILGACDTFRAGAIEQLRQWAQRTGVPIVATQQGHDPSAVAFDTISSAVAKNLDNVILDTAGRLHNKVGLMNELTKIRRVMQKVVPDAPDEVLLVLDGSTGQNAFEQAKQFTAATEVNALAITKLDGTAKGRVVIGISDQFKITVKYIGLGEGIEDLQLFRKKEFVDSLFGE